MPELPEVEAARRAIQENCINKRIRTSTIADDSKVIDGVSPSEFQSSINGKTIVTAHRKGKNLWLQLDSPPFPSFQFGQRNPNLILTHLSKSQLLLTHVVWFVGAGMTGAVYIKGVAVTKYKRWKFCVFWLFGEGDVGVLGFWCDDFGFVCRSAVSEEEEWPSKYSKVFIVVSLFCNLALLGYFVICDGNASTTALCILSYFSEFKLWIVGCFL